MSFRNATEFISIARDSTHFVDLLISTFCEKDRLVQKANLKRLKAQWVEYMGDFEHIETKGEGTGLNELMDVQ